MRSATLSTAHELASAQEYTDVLIQPDIGPVEIRDWKAYDPAVEGGYRVTADILAKLDRPLAELRRRATIAERAATPPLIAAME